MAETKPKASIRRFDVFAEYNRLKGMKEDHLTAAKAKGYGLWVAKVVAAQKFGRMPKPDTEKQAPKTAEEKKREKRVWHKLSGIPQTDKLFDRQIVDRMGATFYRQVFAPAIRKAFEEGKEYREMRDSIRADWKAEKP